MGVAGPANWHMLETSQVRPALSESLDFCNFWFDFVWATARRFKCSPLSSELSSKRVGAVRNVCLHKGVGDENRHQSVLRSCMFGVTQGVLGCARPSILVGKSLSLLSFGKFTGTPSVSYIFSRVLIVFFMSCVQGLCLVCKQHER